ncbi:MAG: type II secretion system protein N [Gammaproteobacteria bacterium]|nr:type II secretion system protein N [Gammaproteobacteria bacterium]MXY56415.1 type II secretion system protein N [Gammaproteobacteria bacterium]MYF29775.1 type II secretion system protein N [Gammaproteobacteria bacterium]MYK47991.1 type II secretion system protein N [Gammaproteobacteria bacterium]
MLSKTIKILVALLGVAALLVLGVALMPARAVKLATDRVDGLTIGAAEGRLFRGEADVTYRGQDLGRATWSMLPKLLLDLQLGTDWQIAHRDYTVSGKAAVGAGTAEFAAIGIIDALAVNRFLAQYHISLDGMFEVDNLDVRLDAAGVAAAGTLRWSGGRALYRLSGETRDVVLPAMVGTFLGDTGQPVLEVVTAEDSLRLLRIRLDADGWAHIDVTARLTALAGAPWRSGGGDDAAVVTVSERLFEPGIADVAVSGG